MSTSTAAGVLVIHGPARLLCGSQPVRLRTKGLALLYVLALEGSVRRDRLCDLLWGHAGSAVNLRVEVHRLGRTLASVGLETFTHRQDPLSLPPGITIDRAVGNEDQQPLEGLDDLSPDFQEWLEAQRAKFGSGQEARQPPLRQQLVDEVARHLEQPYVLVLRGLPGAGRNVFVEALAKRLDLPVDEDPTAPGSGIHFLDAQVADPARVAHHILRARQGVWALKQSTFGSDAELLLRLRNAFPVDLMRFLEFGPIPWLEARSLLLNPIPFEEAAWLYVESGGNFEFLRELLRLRPAEGFNGILPLPQRIRAAYLLEARRLPVDTREVLDRLSIHPGPLGHQLLHHLELTRHLNTLEGSGWLRFDTAWSFSHEPVRRVIQKTVQPGRALLYHEDFAEAFATVDPAGSIAVAYHRSLAGKDPALSGVALDTGAAWAQALLEGRRDGRSARPRPVNRDVALGRERAVLLERHVQLERSDDDWGFWSRRPQETEPSLAEYTLPEDPCVLRIELYVYDENVLGVGLRGDAFPLRLWFHGGPEPDRAAIFADVERDETLDDGTLLLRTRPPRTVAFVCHHRNLRAESRAEVGIVKFRFEAHDVEQPRPERTLAAHDLRSQDSATDDRS